VLAFNIFIYLQYSHVANSHLANLTPIFGFGNCYQRGSCLDSLAIGL